MKFSLKSFVFFLLLAIVAVGCNNQEQLLTKQDGLWQIQSLSRKITVNDVLTSDITQTTGLGQMFFGKAGDGYRTDGGSGKETFTWSVNSKGDKITIYFAQGEFADADIKDSSADAMTMHWIEIADEIQGRVVTETTTTIKRL